MAPSEKIRVDKDFKSALDEIRIERIKNGKDKSMRTNARITRAFTRLSDFDKKMKEIINADFKED